MQKIRPDMNIGQNIRRLRVAHKMKQSEVVRNMQLLGCELCRMTYSKIERNQYNIRVSELVALKQIFDVDYSEFFAGLSLEESLPAE